MYRQTFVPAFGGYSAGVKAGILRFKQSHPAPAEDCFYGRLSSPNSPQRLPCRTRLSVLPAFRSRLLEARPDRPVGGSGRFCPFPHQRERARTAPSFRNRAPTRREGCTESCPGEVRLAAFPTCRSVVGTGSVCPAHPNGTLRFSLIPNSAQDLELSTQDRDGGFGQGEDRL